MGQSLTGVHSFLLPGRGRMISVFITVTVTISSLSLMWALTFKSMLKGSLRRDAAGNRIWKLSFGFLSVCEGGHAYV